MSASVLNGHYLDAMNEAQCRCCGTGVYSGSRDSCDFVHGAARSILSLRSRRVRCVYRYELLSCPLGVCLTRHDLRSTQGIMNSTASLKYSCIVVGMCMFVFVCV